MKFIIVISFLITVFYISESFTNTPSYLNNVAIGVTGSTGSTGHQDFRGVQGKTGPQGPKGETGSQGPTGDIYSDLLITDIFKTEPHILFQYNYNISHLCNTFCFDNVMCKGFISTLNNEKEDQCTIENKYTPESQLNVIKDKSSLSYLDIYVIVIFAVILMLSIICVNVFIIDLICRYNNVDVSYIICT